MAHIIELLKQGVHIMKRSKFFIPCWMQSALHQMKRFSFSEPYTKPTPHSFRLCVLINQSFLAHKTRKMEVLVSSEVQRRKVSLPARSRLCPTAGEELIPLTQMKVTGPLQYPWYSHGMWEQQSPDIVPLVLADRLPTASHDAVVRKYRTQPPKIT